MICYVDLALSYFRSEYSNGKRKRDFEKATSSSLCKPEVTEFGRTKLLIYEDLLVAICSFDHADLGS